MARIKPSSPSLQEAGTRFRWLRPHILAVLLLIVSLGLGTHLLWQHSQPIVAKSAQYLITSDDIHITPPPPWIRSDIKREALRDAGLSQPLSLLDDWPAVAERIEKAFEFHPWVASVDRISKSLPSSLTVELTYRRPVAAVESSDSNGVAFLPVNEQAIRLPEADLTDAERRHLPRISGVTGRPLVGDHWNDPRVNGGAKLAAALADVWQQLQLVEIVAIVESQSASDRPQYSFEIVTTGGTRIAWGSAPGMEADAGESPCVLKRAQLLRFCAQQGGLDSVDGPARLDVRRELVVTPRTARNKTEANRAEPTQTK
jgi:cell division septal protein FtsQ